LPVAGSRRLDTLQTVNLSGHPMSAEHGATSGPWTGGSDERAEPLVDTGAGNLRSVRDALLLTGGIGELLALAVGTLLVTNYLAHRQAYSYPRDQHPRHGDRMD
jgi:hypothetical protein